MNTQEWAQSLGIPSSPLAPPVPADPESYIRSAEDVARRTLILQGVAAVGFDVPPEPIVAWFRGQNLWDHVTANEKSFLQATDPTDHQRIEAQWRQEAEWALLWCISKVDVLGLPTQFCDTTRLVDEIIPPLGSDVRDFVGGAILRPPSALLAEDDRTYNMWCYALSTRRDERPLPDDLNWGVLYQRRYAFEWLDGNQCWDEVTCDA